MLEILGAEVDTGIAQPQSDLWDFWSSTFHAFLHDNAHVRLCRCWIPPDPTPQKTLGRFPVDGILASEYRKFNLK